MATGNHPKVSDWLKYEEILNAGLKGWNPLQRLPELLQKEYSWLGDFNFGFFVESDLPDRMSVGWQFLEKEHFDFDDFNKAVGLRFGLTDDGAGHIKFKNNYIMIMPKQYREKLTAKREQEYERQYERSVEAQKYVAPGDKGGMGESVLEEEFLEVNPAKETATTVKRGRPRKT